MIKEYKFNYRFTQKRRGQKKPEKAKRSPTSFLQESYIGSIRYHRIFPLRKGNQKNLGITAMGRSFCHRSASVNIH